MAKKVKSIVPAPVRKLTANEAKAAKKILAVAEKMKLPVTMEKLEYAISSDGIITACIAALNK